MLLKQKVGWLKTLVLTMVSLPVFAVNWPDVPLGVSSSAPPMTMIVAGKDHKLFYEAYNDASDIDGDGSLDVRFRPDITYYGLFDATLCYSYGSGNSLFEPREESRDGKCSGLWSGNWLNYVTTSRIDALRKVLYGGYREIDTETMTVLRRAYIPQDAHSWAKEYTSAAVDGYRISDYTPLAMPSGGKRHFFGNLTANASVSCNSLDNCSNLPPLMAVVTNTSRRVWEWASKERPVLDGSHGGSRTDYTVRVLVCTADFNRDCKQYPSGNFKPVGLLHEYGEDNSMLFGLLTGSYNKNTSGGVLRKVVSSFSDEVDSDTGIFTASNTIVHNFDVLRIRDYNHNRTDKAYRSGWVTNRPMQRGEFIDWGNPIAEMMYEGLRYFAGKGSPTPGYFTSGSYDAQVGLTVADWDNPYSGNSAAKAEWCAKPNMLVMSDINPSFDSDELPGSSFQSFGGDVAALNVKSVADSITRYEPDVRGEHFIGQSQGVYDGAPTAKTVNSLGTIRGLAPEEPTKQGSYYSASVSYFAKSNDINPARGDQTIDSFYVALASPLPSIAFPVNGRIITLVPFAKSVGNNRGPWTGFQPTNQIVDFYVDTLANLPGSPMDRSVNEGRPYAKFRINFEDVEQGADHDMDAIVEYEISATSSGNLSVKLTTTYAAGSIIQHMGYVISGSTSDGTYLVVRDPGHPESADPDYALDVPNDSNALPFTSTRTFSPGRSGATFLKDPLWYAAKWGGFVDNNGNLRPDIDDEWDQNNDGVPDTYFLVQNPLKLKDSLRRTLDNIIARTANAGNITANSSSISSDSLVFQSVFNTATWSGDLLAYPITATGVDGTPLWRASQRVPNPSSRDIFTYSGGNGVTFSWSTLSSADQTAIGSRDVLDYIRGERADEQQNGGGFRDRAANNILGDIVHSPTVYEKDTDTVYAGSNDGMLHAFDATTGRERFAYIPSALLSKLKNLTDPYYVHDYYVDGEIAVSSRANTGQNYLVGTLGLGGKGLYSLDITNPGSFRASDVNWEYHNAADPDLGFMSGRPIIALMNNGNWVVIVGNGYNSNSGKAVLYIFDLANGSLIRKIDTGAAVDNGMATPAVFDEDNDGDVDWIYAGDLRGNVWKFDVTASSPATWGSAFEQAGSPAPLFTAVDAGGDPQPITAPVSVAVNDVTGDPNYNKRFIFFGTGSYFRSGDPNDSQVQSWYGLIDEDATIASREVLRQRSISDQGTVGSRPVRVFDQGSTGDMAGVQGWYMDFDTDAGERIVTTSRYYRLVVPALIASSIIPVADPCEPGGRGFINAINPFTGERLTQGIFDVDNSDSFSDDLLNTAYISSVDIGVGMPGEAVLIGDRLVIGGATGAIGDIRVNLGVTPIRGRISWRELVRE
ncbi:MAG: PilC/PilY family type IV pilus protein [Ketobacteraceae bacterium]|nr:PilC/PilY family type IV pilus protein [Ketobacteraceae bacterium]